MPANAAPSVSRAAAVPAACPMTKQPPLARAADWPSCVMEAQRPATSRLVTLVGNSMLVQPTQRIDARQQIVHHAMHQLLHFAVSATVQASEVGNAASGSHAAQKAIALNQQGAGAAFGRTEAGRQAGRPATNHDDIELAINRQRACRFGNGVQTGRSWHG